MNLFRGQIFLFLILPLAGYASDALRETVSGDSVVMLNELNVVAVKQNADLFSLPVSSTSITTEVVEQLDISDIKKISDISPNFYIPQYGSRITSSIYVRGIGARMDQPSVGLTIDNMPVMNKDAYDLDIPDIAEIDILRGPQSSLFGRNTMAGLVNIRTLSPMKYQGWRFNIRGGFPGYFKFSGGWYRRFSQDLAFSVNTGVYHSGGEFQNEFDNSRTGREWSGNIRMRLESHPARNLSLSNIFSLSILKQNGYPYESVISGKIDYNDPCFYRRFLLSDGFSLKWSAVNYDLLSVTSLQVIDDNMTLDQDFLTDSFFTLTQKKREVSLTEDLTFRSKNEGIYNWITGVFSFYRHLDMNAPVTFKEDGIRDLIVSHRNDANPYRPIRWSSDSFCLNSDFILPSVGVALYHESRLDLERWHFAAGLRFDFEHISMDYHSYCNTSYEIFDNPSGILTSSFQGAPARIVDININDKGALSRNYLTILPKISALFDLSDSGISNIYINVGRGYKAGGFNTQMFSDVLQQSLMNVMGMASAYDVDKIVSYKPEECWSFEIGSHFETMGGKLTSEVSMFYIDIHNQQLTMFPDGTTTGRIMTNAGKTRSVGGELSLLYRPLKSLSFNLAYGYTNVRFREFFNGIQDFKGKVLPYAPSNTLWFQAQYVLHHKNLGKKAIIFDLNIKGNGKIYWNEENSLSQNFFILPGASVTLTSPSWELQIYGKNLTDTRYNTFYFKSMGNEFVQRGEGINFGLSFSMYINNSSPGLKQAL